MKNHMRRFVSIAGSVAALSVVLGSSLIVAQNRGKEVASIPFAFHARETNLPAGKYVVTVANTQGVLQISDANTGRSIMMATRCRESSRNGAPRLTFHRYGNEYFLSQVWMPDQADGYSLSMTAREKELAKQPGQLALATVHFQGE